MNLCVLAGRIVGKASVKGTDRKVLRFTVETRDGHDEGETKKHQVPCVLFNPSPELEEKLSSGGEGLRVELKGRIASWGGETNGGRSNAEVVVFNRSLAFAKV